jgi:hypothetical protein
MRAPLTKCQRYDCHNTITQPQNGRRKRFCSDGCRIRVHRCNETPDKAKWSVSRIKRITGLPYKNGQFRYKQNQ